MSPGPSSLQLTLLDGKSHRREAFSCGEPSLDKYLREQASQDHKRHAATPYVLVASDAPNDIIGYFTLSTLGIALLDLPANVRKLLPKYPEVPALLIGRLAVATAYQGQRHGNELLRRAIMKCFEASQMAAASLIVVDALHAKAVAFYSKYDFEPFDDDPTYPKRLFIPLARVPKGP